MAVANFTWVGNSMGAAGDAWPRRLGWRAAGLDADRSGGDSALVGSWPLPQVRLNETDYPRNVGPVRLGAWRAIRFGREVDDLLQAHRAVESHDGVRWDALAEVALMTTSRGPFEEDVFFVLTYDDGSSHAIPLGEATDLLPRLQQLPGFDNETFIRTMGVSEDGVSTLWRR